MRILSTSTLLLVSADIMFLLRQAAQGRRAPGSGRDIAEATCGLPGEELPVARPDVPFVHSHVSLLSHQYTGHFPSRATSC